MTRITAWRVGAVRRRAAKRSKAKVEQTTQEGQFRARHPRIRDAYQGLPSTNRRDRHRSDMQSRSWPAIAGCAWLPKLPHRYSAICIYKTQMTRKSKQEIVVFYAIALQCKSLALRHLSYYHIHSCHIYLASLRCHTPVMCILTLRQPGYLQQRQDVSPCCTVRWLCR